jgi:hypothetical protein
VGPAGTGWCEQLSERYVEICDELNIPIVTDCKKFEKAFTCSQFGKVLGIFFDSNNGTWQLPASKVEKTKNEIFKIMNAKVVDLHDMQVLMGRLNDISLMSNFLYGFKQPLNLFLGELQRLKNAKLTLPNQARKDLLVWSGFLCNSNTWFPICPEISGPPLATVVFVSDAAGISGNSNPAELVGAGCIGLNCEQKMFFAKQIFWPTSVLLKTKDCKGSRFGSKTTTLEFLGMILPFLIIPGKWLNQHVILKVDNIACYYGWESRGLSGDVCASIIIRALHLISTYLCCEIHVVHLLRVSTREARLVDRLSRQRTTTVEDSLLLKEFSCQDIPECLKVWMKNPTEDWSLADSLLDFVKCTTNKPGL